MKVEPLAASSSGRRPIDPFTRGLKGTEEHEQESGHSPRTERWYFHDLFTRKMLLSTFLVLAASIGFHKLHFAWSSSTAQDSVIDLGYAKYLGNRTVTWPNTVSYLGLPYAEPPVGERRFRAPLPLNTARVAKETKGKIVDARAYPEPCIQGALGPGQLRS